jgi:hypothetical protein
MYLDLETQDLVGKFAPSAYLGIIRMIGYPKG